MHIEELRIKYPAGFEQAVHLTKEEMEQHIRLMAALKMFELGKISSGKAAELAGMSRIEFFEACGRYRVSVFNYPPDELEDEIKKDMEAARKSGCGTIKHSYHWPHRPPSFSQRKRNHNKSK